MGRNALPPILKLEEVLDLITNSEKYIKYIKEFQALYQEAKLALGDLDTKEKADMYLSQAMDENTRVKKEKTKAQELLAEAYARQDAINKEIDLAYVQLKLAKDDVERKTQELAADKKSYAEYKTEHDKSIVTQRAEVTKLQAEANALTQELSAKRAKLTEALKSV